MSIAVAPSAHAQPRQAPATGTAPATTTAAAPADGEPRYLATLRTELEAMQLSPTCETRNATNGTCTVTLRGPTTGRAFEAHLVYSDETDTVYMYVAGYASADARASGTAPLLRRLMELNWELLAGKFEWNPGNGEVRVAMVLHTDSNFDRRALRSLLRALGTVADRYSNEISRLAGNAPVPTAPSTPTPAAPVNGR